VSCTDRLLSAKSGQDRFKSYGRLSLLEVLSPLYKGYELKSEFLESELELYVQRLLIHESYATGHQYKMLKISPSEERLKGYDAEIVGMTSFYCQFKTSDLLTKGAMFKKRQEFCATVGWPKTPFYTFALRVPNDPDDKKKLDLWQHNVLHSLWQSNKSGVAYVAPMFHTRAEMDLHEPNAYRGCCLCHLHYSRCSAGYAASGVTIGAGIVNRHMRCRLPIFDGLVSIPPHAPVKDLKHSYCFTSQADVSFHSDPQRVSASTFNESLQGFVRAVFGAEKLAISDARMTLSEVQKLIGIDQDEKFLEIFLGYGLNRAGVTRQVAQQSAVQFFEEDTTWLQQRIAFSAALYAYFGISTIALFKIEKNQRLNRLRS